MKMMLIVSYLAYFIGPFIFQFCSRFKQGRPILEGFIVVAVGGLSLSHVIHFIGEHNIFIILAILGIGLYLPNFFEGIFSKSKKDIHSFVHVLVVIAFLIHVFLEASVLSQAGNHFTALHSGILIHRVTDGMLIWWLLLPKYGHKIAGIGISLLIIANLIGFFYSSNFHLSSHLWDYLEILMSGMLLHVLLFSFHLDNSAHHSKASCCKKSDHQKPRKNKYRGIGNLIGLIFLALFFYFINHDHPGHQASNQQTFFNNLIDLFYLSSPALLVAFVLSGIIQVSITLKTLKWFNRGNRFAQSMKGMILGLPLPICSCGILPFYQTLVKKGLAPAAGLAFLISTPELGLDALLLSLPLLGLDLTIARLLAAVFLSLGISWILSPMLGDNKTIPLVEDVEEDLSGSKLSQFWHYATKKIIDDIAPLVMLGLVVAALFQLVLGDYNFVEYQGWDVVLAAIVGIFLYVCASGATPVVAIFLAAGVSPGAAISFLMTGPATNVSTFAVLSKLHGKKFATAFALVALVLAVFAGYLTNLIFKTSEALPASQTLHHHHSATWWEHSAVAVVGLLFILCLLRRIGVLK